MAKFNIMNTKLTLNLNKEIIQGAKDYAKEHNISLSFLVENYLQKIISDYKIEAASKGSIVNELSGIIKLDLDANHRDDHIDYLTEKYK
ncbi:MAG: hypothetical protein DHS20C13_29070 [Thermodesulfobacteriota bacterium]|nr:MAG: hypothetical protein DHS20C13_29070 [Thermodesulfobacteriota bacterium]GJM36619.1 MAG: hypothetical protein DHS20C18_56200 [Saprospiraceae bacterium]